MPTNPIDLNVPGRLRAKDVIGLLRVSKSTFYEGLRSGRYPGSDGADGRMVYWKTETVRAFLAGEK
jgi:predicted DNA-binding transcriptional regulator AlpA